MTLLQQPLYSTTVSIASFTSTCVTFELKTKIPLCTCAVVHIRPNAPQCTVWMVAGYTAVPLEDCVVHRHQAGAVYVVIVLDLFVMLVVLIAFLSPSFYAVAFENY